mmetsp:Transcript_55/g.211  ORF Transcript_55/g.211 Transcript_55/m.211 type:complete len:260 (-) Transcript_55:463-1242(-)
MARRRRRDATKYQAAGVEHAGLKHPGDQAHRRAGGCEDRRRGDPRQAVARPGDRVTIERREHGRARGFTSGDARGAGVHLRGDRLRSPQRGGGERYAHRHLLRHAQRGAGCRSAARRHRRALQRDVLRGAELRAAARARPHHAGDVRVHGVSRRARQAGGVRSAGRGRRKLLRQARAVHHRHLQPHDEGHQGGRGGCRVAGDRVLERRVRGGGGDPGGAGGRGLEPPGVPQVCRAGARPARTHASRDAHQAGRGPGGGR